jgi:hypothetical protein
MNYPPDDLLAKIRNPPPGMRVRFDSGDDRFHFALRLFSLYNPGASATELAEAAVEALEGGREFPSLRGIRP